MATSIHRRSALAILGLGCASLWARSAGATLVRGLTLEALVRGSDRIAVGTALDASSHWETIGGARRIVTDTRVGIDETIFGPTDSELLVRTYGGRIGKIGELVYGEPELVLGAPFLAFLRRSEQLHYVLGMAQGHYPLEFSANRARYLRPSPRLPELLQPETSAVRHLAGRELAQAKTMILEVRAP